MRCASHSDLDPSERIHLSVLVADRVGLMAAKHRTQGNRRSRNAKARRRAVGAGSAVGAFLAFGMTPLATAPPARADLFDFDWIGDLLGGMGDAAGAASGVDLGGLVDPGVFGDLSAWLDPSTWADQLQGVTELPVSATTMALPLGAEPLAAGAGDPSFELFNQLIYTPIHTDLENWIHSPFGEQIDGFN